MAINNTVTLIGNLDSDILILEGSEKKYAIVRMATTDSYQDKKTKTWINKKTVWHNLVAFGPKIIDALDSLSTKDRIKITGSLNYRTFEAMTEYTDPARKKEASIIVRKVELLPISNES